MMKKKVLLYASLILVILLIISIVLVITKKNTSKRFSEQEANITYEDDGKTESKLISLTNKVELNRLIEKFKLDSSEESNSTIVRGCSVVGKKATFCYEFDSEGNLINCSVYISLFGVIDYKDENDFKIEDYSSKDIKIQTNTVLSWMSNLLKTNLKNKELIISKDGVSLEVNDKAFSEVQDNDAIIRERILDLDGFLWEIRISKADYGILECVIEKTFPNDDFDEAFVDVIVS